MVRRTILAVRIRMKRVGRTNSPCYRIVAADARSPRDGRIIETLGSYYPRVAEPDKQVVLDEQRAKYWMSVGAQTSETVASIFRKRGIQTRMK